MNTSHLLSFTVIYNNPLPIARALRNVIMVNLHEADIGDSSVTDRIFNVIYDFGEGLHAANTIVKLENVTT